MKKHSNPLPHPAWYIVPSTTNLSCFCLCISQAFRASLAEELKELSGSPFGSTLVGTIGLAYYEAAVAELSTVDGLSVQFAQSARSVTTGTYSIVCLF